MLKKCLMILALLYGALSATAAVQYMTIELKSGGKFSFLLADNPIVTYANGDLSVNGSPSTSYAISGVKNYHFTEKNETGLSSVSSETLSIVSLDDNTLGIQNAPASAKAILLTATGVVASTAVVDASGAATLVLPQQKGLYVLSVGELSIKLIRK
ncbi:MAG: hypothetical protein J5554_00485 [Paludibacteraceae bacterium]|nr:hypothetical protein [Paludibacteraceae bacterium]